MKILLDFKVNTIYNDYRLETQKEVTNYENYQFYGTTHFITRTIKLWFI